jgi:putative N6-adenine-specific DNA methylase
MKHDWSLYLGEHDNMSIDHTINSEYFTHSQYASLKVKDAIVDQFRNKTGYRPTIDVKYPDVKFDVYAYNELFTISLDSSGEPLNRRGYRDQGHRAPLKEVLAAGMLKLSGWTPDRPLLDPMCGTGTILVEAAMIAANIPVQTLRKEFGFKRWRNFQPMLWSRVQSEASAKIKTADFKIQGGDTDAKAVRMANQSLKLLRMNRKVTVTRADFLKATPRYYRGVIVTNPPYGERLEKDDINAFYKEISDVLKEKYTGYDAWFLSSNKEALTHLKLSPSKKIKLFNGKLDCSFEKYELYEGSQEEKDLTLEI